MTQQNKIFADGLKFELPHEKAPYFVKGRLSIKVPEFISFLEKNQSNAGWVNIDIKMSQKGNGYGELNTWKPSEVKKEVEQKKEPMIDPETGIDCNPENAPF